MKVLIDECLPAGLKESIAALGHELSGGLPKRGEAPFIGRCASQPFERDALQTKKKATKSNRTLRIAAESRAAFGRRM